VQGLGAALEVKKKRGGHGLNGVKWWWVSELEREDVWWCRAAGYVGGGARVAGSFGLFLQSQQQAKTNRTRKKIY
jgi:hypothetical protein